jgi:hypothetical protein
MRILVDRFIYQGLRYVPSRHAAVISTSAGPLQDQDEKGSLTRSQPEASRPCRLGASSDLPDGMGGCAQIIHSVRSPFHGSEGKLASGLAVHRQLVLAG